MGDWGLLRGRSPYMTKHRPSWNRVRAFASAFSIKRALAASRKEHTVAYVSGQPHLWHRLFKAGQRFIAERLGALNERPLDDPQGTPRARARHPGRWRSHEPACSLELSLCSAESWRWRLGRSMLRARIDAESGNTGSASSMIF